MKKIQLLTCVLFCLSCACSDLSTSANSEPIGAALAPQQLVEEPKQIISATDTLYKGDTLKIDFETPHHKDLGIVTPDGAFFFAVYNGNDSTKPSLVNYDEFEHLGHLQIITDKSKLNPWNEKYKENQLVFTKTGVYEIQLSEHLDTKEGAAVETEKVYYFDGVR